MLRITANDSGFVMPERVAAGVTEIHLVNQGTTTHEGVFEHFLTPDGNGAAFAESLRAGVDVPAFAIDAGGPGLATPGDATRIWMDLKPGHYAVTCWYAGHVEHGAFSDFDIVPAESHARPPRTDLSVRMTNYTYEFGGRWSAGSHVVQVENAGTEVHEFDPYRLEPGRSPTTSSAGSRPIGTGHRRPSRSVAAEPSSRDAGCGCRFGSCPGDTSRSVRCRRIRGEIEHADDRLP